MNVDTHLHLSGCISPGFVWDTINRLNMPFLGESLEDVTNQMTYGPEEHRTFNRFLDKFRLLDQIPWTEEILDLAISDASKYLHHNEIDYAWIDFSINKYMCIGWHKYEAIKFIHDRFNHHAFGKVGLVLALKYEYPRSGQKIYSKLIDNDEIKQYLIGIDLVGDEAYFDAEFYADILSDWVKCGKMVRAHVGESQPVVNIRSAIEQLSVTNVAHGIKIVDDEKLMMQASQVDVTFDLCITSNYETGVLSQSTEHPILKMAKNGLKITLGSDDPIQFSTSLPAEYEKAKKIGVTNEMIDSMRRLSVENAKRFLA